MAAEAGAGVDSAATATNARRHAEHGQRIDERRGGAQEKQWRADQKQGRQRPVLRPRRVRPADQRGDAQRGAAQAPRCHQPHQQRMLARTLQREAQLEQSHVQRWMRPRAVEARGMSLRLQHRVAGEVASVEQDAPDGGVLEGVVLDQRHRGHVEQQRHEEAAGEHCGRAAGQQVARGHDRAARRA
ncbi:MAG: hypothetical protein U1F25_19875 [Rubrivivax sp.]